MSTTPEGSIPDGMDWISGAMKLNPLDDENLFRTLSAQTTKTWGNLEVRSKSKDEKQMAGLKSVLLVV